MKWNWPWVSRKKYEEERKQSTERIIKLRTELELAKDYNRARYQKLDELLETLITVKKKSSFGAISRKLAIAIELTEDVLYGIHKHDQNTMRMAADSISTIVMRVLIKKGVM